MVQHGPKSRPLIHNQTLAFVKPKWTKVHHFGLKRCVLVNLGLPTALWQLLSHMSSLPPDFLPYLLSIEGLCDIRLQISLGNAKVTGIFSEIPVARKLSIANASAPYRGQNPENREKRVKKLPFPSTPGRFESENPHFFSARHHKENGDFLTRSAGALGNGSFFDPETPFPRFSGC